MQQLPAATPGQRRRVLPGVRCVELPVRKSFARPLLEAEGRMAERTALVRISALLRLGTMTSLAMTTPSSHAQRFGMAGEPRRRILLHRMKQKAAGRVP